MYYLNIYYLSEAIFYMLRRVENNKSALILKNNHKY